MQISTATIVRFLLTTLGLFAAIYLLAVLTPWLAKHIDSWIARYRENHSPRKDPGYGFRSIYELPPEELKEPDDPPSPSGDAPEADQNEERSQSNGKE